jgi:hypothetical protein
MIGDVRWIILGNPNVVGESTRIPRCTCGHVLLALGGVRKNFITGFGAVETESCHRHRHYITLDFVLHFSAAFALNIAPRMLFRHGRGQCFE